VACGFAMMFIGVGAPEVGEHSWTQARTSRLPVRGVPNSLLLCLTDICWQSNLKKPTGMESRKFLGLRSKQLVLENSRKQVEHYMSKYIRSTAQRRVISKSPAHVPTPCDPKTPRPGQSPHPSPLPSASF
jgi:hypothetical protein